MKLISHIIQRIYSCDRSPTLYNEGTFYPAFHRSIRRSQQELIIESPFMTVRRVNTFLPELKKLVERGVKVTVNTRDPREHDSFMRLEAEQALIHFQDIGVNVLFTGGLHRKLAIIDRTYIWEGSLNILSQNDSCEIMREVKSTSYARQIIKFIGIGRFLLD